VPASPSLRREGRGCHSVGAQPVARSDRKAATLPIDAGHPSDDHPQVAAFASERVAAFTPEGWPPSRRNPWPASTGIRSRSTSGGSNASGGMSSGCGSAPWRDVARKAGRRMPGWSVSRSTGCPSPGSTIPIRPSGSAAPFKAGAQCAKGARWDLCGGRRATGVPTAIRRFDSAPGHHVTQLSSDTYGNTSVRLGAKGARWAAPGQQQKKVASVQRRLHVGCARGVR